MLIDMEEKMFIRRLPKGNIVIDAKGFYELIQSNLLMCRTEDEIDFVKNLFEDTIGKSSNIAIEELKEVNRRQIKEGMFVCGS